MDLQKRKYKQKEVKAILDVYQRQYENIIKELKSRIYELAKKNTDLQAEVESVRAKEGLIIATLTRAEQMSSDIKGSVENQYAFELERLKKFVTEWEEFFQQLKNEYSNDPKVKKALKIKEKVKKGTKATAKKTIDEIEKVIDTTKPTKGKKFNPKEKIGEYIASTSDSGFDLNEVLNPGKIELEDICKELGLIDEN